MATIPKPRPAQATQSTERREAREAAALRANLGRRKAQARGRDDADAKPRPGKDR